MDSIFVAGIVGAAVGAAVGTWSKRRTTSPAKVASIAAGVAAATFLVIAIITALL